MKDQRAITKYIGRLDRKLRLHASYRRREILDEVKAHIDEEIAELGHDPTESDIEGILQRVGDPESIASQEAGNARAARVGTILGITALVLLIAGGFLHFPIGWLVGVGLLWAIPRWTSRQKLLGTLLIPGGLMLPIYIWMSGCSTSNPVFDGRSTRYICDWFDMPRELMIGIVATLALTSLGCSGYLSTKLRRPGSSYLSRSILTSPFLAVLIIVGAVCWSATREELASGVGTEGPWRLVVSWEFTYCIKYQYSLGEQGACGILPDGELSTSFSREVLRVDDVSTVVAGEVPSGTALVEIVRENGRVVSADIRRVMGMAFYVAEVPGMGIDRVRALDDGGNLVDEVAFVGISSPKPGQHPAPSP